jgi:hypothetical protein
MPPMTSYHSNGNKTAEIMTMTDDLSVSRLLFVNCRLIAHNDSIGEDVDESQAAIVESSRKRTLSDLEEYGARMS